ncbi:DNA repair protein RadA [Limnobacter humi]|uniref:DNA repair protein RadA n=1 Tax=Limnobacter humi TaxID=1778671 RepID=A0ABT1WFC2_9BURK|nr:DNA repair protein RadA [Limnobacter humi]MCQ8896215.1 DNA repair protein RadA [Limnobacter humi]
MAKAKSQYQCTECGAVFAKWQGQCGECNNWNTVVESLVAPVTPKNNRFTALAAQSSQVIKLADIQAQEYPRFSSGVGEFDRVLGGGLVPGMVVLLGGDPGIGKSTLLLQSMVNLAQQVNTLYVSGEESAGQIALRAQRLGLEHASLSVLTEIQLEQILAQIEILKPQVLVIDSIQTLYTAELSAAPGSVSQVRECASQLTRVAKSLGITTILVGHVTKEGTLAGPRVLEHIVDTVLYFEGDSQSSFRLVRAFKNRFGAVNELGVFAMTDRGLKGVNNPSALFLSQQTDWVPGSCVMVTQEGARPLLVEIQALVDSSHSPAPRRLSVGLEQNRLAMLLAVLHRHAGLQFFDQDIFINAVGGVRISEPAADLAIVLAMVSSLKNKRLPRELAVFGEIGLSGELRPAPRGQDRLREAAKLGFTHALVPASNVPKQTIEGLQVIGVERIEQALSALRDTLHCF